MKINKLFQTSKKFFKKTQNQFEKFRETLQAMKNKTEIEEEILCELEKAPNTNVIDISATSVAKATLTIIGLLLLTYIFYEIKDILIMLFISIFLATVIDPMVDKMETQNIPRWLGVIIIYLIVLFIIIFFIANIIPLVFSQIKEIVINVSQYLNNLYFDFIQGNFSLPLIPDTWNETTRDFLKYIQLKEILEYFAENLTNIQQYLEGLANGSIEALKKAGVVVGDTVTTIISFIFKFTLIIFFIFFIVVEKKELKQFFMSLFPHQYAPYLMNKITAVQKKVGAWFNGTLILVTCMFLLSLTGLLIFRVDYAITLALLTGIADVIPYLGPFIAYLAIVPIALNESTWTFVWITIWVPLVMQKAVGLSPIVVMTAMLIGFHFLGILGVILAIPIATSISIFVHDYTDKNKFCRSQSTENKK
jgi:predicted PurR-regulated permease PerM